MSPPGSPPGGDILTSSADRSVRRAGNRSIRGRDRRTRGGERATGVVKTEDAFSLQVVTQDGALRSFAKRDLAELVRERESAMPVFGSDRIGEAALEDLLSFLGTLRGSRQ